MNLSASQSPIAPSPVELPVELIVALDVPSIGQAEELLRELRGLPVIYKVGFELFLTAGPQWVGKLTAQGQRVFLDLKFYDIPNTAASAVRQARALGVEMFTFHLSGGHEMAKAILGELAPTEGSSRTPLALGVSVLTSFEQEGWNETVGSFARNPATIEQAVLGLAQKATQWGVSGLVCSPKELQAIKTAFGHLYTVVPGVRPEGSDRGDQQRILTPKEAAAAGASAIVVGRPILRSQSPRQATEQILNELKAPFKELP